VLPSQEGRSASGVTQTKAFAQGWSYFSAMLAPVSLSRASVYELLCIFKVLHIILLKINQ
jgi:hypothetical protein